MCKHQSWACQACNNRTIIKAAKTTTRTLRKWKWKRTTCRIRKKSWTSKSRKCDRWCLDMRNRVTRWRWRCRRRWRITTRWCIRRNMCRKWHTRRWWSRCQSSASSQRPCHKSAPSSNTCRFKERSLSTSLVRGRSKRSSISPSPGVSPGLSSKRRRNRPEKAPRINNHRHKFKHNYNPTLPRAMSSHNTKLQCMGHHSTCMEEGRVCMLRGGRVCTLRGGRVVCKCTQLETIDWDHSHKEIQLLSIMSRRVKPRINKKNDFDNST